MKAPTKTVNVRRRMGHSPTASDVKEIVRNAAARKAEAKKAAPVAKKSKR